MSQVKIDEVFKSYKPENFDPVDCLQKCLEIIDEVFFAHPEELLKVTNAQDVSNASGYASRLFLANNLPAAALEMLLQPWKKLVNLQEQTKQRVYRAGICMHIAKTYLQLNDQGAAIHWALLTHAGDLLGEHSAGGGAGKQMLLAQLGIPPEALNDLNDLATENLAIVKAAADWSSPLGFEEDLVTKLSIKKPEYAQLLSIDTTVEEFPINKSYLKGLIDELDADGTSTEKGNTLEHLASYLFSLIPGLVPRRNLLAESSSFELDLVIRNLHKKGNIVTDILGRHFLAECKNWKDRVGVRDVGYFLYRIRLTHAHFGIIFAKNGITGGMKKMQLGA